MIDSVRGAGATCVVSVRTGRAGDVPGVCHDSVYSREHEKDLLGVAIAKSMQGHLAV